MTATGRLSPEQTEAFFQRVIDRSSLLPDASMRANRWRRLVAWLRRHVWERLLEIVHRDPKPEDLERWWRGER